MNNPTPLRVLLVDHHALFRKRIVSLRGEASLSGVMAAKLMEEFTRQPVSGMRLPPARRTSARASRRCWRW